MSSLRILFVGSSSEASTSAHRAGALRRIGHSVFHVDPYRAFKGSLSGFFGSFNYRTGYALIQPSVTAYVDSVNLEIEPCDVCWVDGGELLGHAAVQRLHSKCGRVVLFNHDDPSGKRDHARFRSLRAALPQYDLCAVVRSCNVPEFRQLGARAVAQVWRSYDEVAHRKPDEPALVRERFRSDVAFIGRNIRGESRDRFLAALIDSGLRPAIWGDNWRSSRYWSKLRPYFRGDSLAGPDYVEAIRGAKICLGLLSSGNRDQHTTRSMEIPFAGGLLCAERTAEHMSLYADGEEAVFWSDLDECASACAALLADTQRQERIKAAGYRRVVRNRVGNEDLCATVLASTMLTNHSVQQDD